MEDLKQLYRSFLQKSILRPTFALAVVGAAGLELPAMGQTIVTRADSIEVKGVVRDEDGSPIIGASVQLSGTKKMTLTDVDGQYRLTVPSNGTLVFAYLGYEKKSVPVSGKAKMNVQLLPSKDTSLKEVVVIGYGTVRKGDLTGSVSNVKMNDIKDAPVLSVDQALQGRVAGADIMSTTGEPGATTSIRIRGTRSVSASNEPLIVVDGVMDAVHDLNDLNIADIQSISVLKDASSTAIYGSRGSNGVIIVTTKSGYSTGGKPSITFKGDAGFSALPSKLDIMNASELAQYRNDYAYFSGSAEYEGVGPGTPLSGYPFKDPLSLGEGTDWIDQIARTAMYQNYALSLSGGNGRSTYYVSGSYNNTQGIIKKSGQERITGRVSLTHKLFSWLKVGYNGSYTWRHNDQNLAAIGGTSWWNSAMYLSPLMKPMDSYNPFYYSGQKINTPMATIELNTNYLERHSTNHTAFVEITPLKGLTLKSQASYYLYQRHTYQYSPSTLPAKVDGQGGDAYRAEWDEHSLLSENTATWQQTFGSHTVNALVGFTGQRFGSHNFALSGTGYMDDDVKWNNMNAVQDKQTYSATTDKSDKVKMSVLARFNYDYRKRYYLTMTGRYDGASNFAANNKWGFFPSAALKWNMAEESFLKSVKWIDELSVRLSAGRTGNDAISAYRSLAALSSTTGGYLFGGSQPAAFYPSRLDSPNLTWEKTDLYNLGLDVALFNNRVQLTAEAYISKTSDLLLTVQTPRQTGYTSRFANIGKTTNKGLEVTLDTRNISRPGFSWGTTLTFAHNKQMVDDIGTEDFVVAYGAPGNNSYMMYGYVKGYPLNALWGFKYGGVWKNQAEVERNKATHAYASATASTSLGTARYLDINHDGTLNQNDLVYQGNADPWVYGGLQNNFRIGNLNIGVYFTYSLGGKIYNYAELYMAGSTFTNQYRYMLDSWHPVRNPDSDIPRAGSVDVNVPSDFQIHDATFVRLKSVSIGYTFNLYEKTKLLRDLTLSVNGENLYLWKKYNGFDPDVSTDGSSVLRRMDLGAYPKARTITFSAQLRY